MLIAVCICTFRRPEGLRATLNGLQRLEYRLEDRPDLHVVVVDNEGSEATRVVVEDFAAAGMSVSYVVEGRRGISHARNACLDNVPETARYVAFLDDDWVPRPDWLDELLAVAEAGGATATTGPCFPVYDAGVPEWIRGGRFFASPRAKRPRNHGAVGFGVMGNILFDAAFLRQSRVRFNERFGRIGGEDRRFFLDLFGKGAAFVWAEHAIVDHFVETKRLSWGYILRREFSVGYAAAILERSETPGSGRLFGYALRTVAKLALKIFLLAPAALLGAVRHDAFRRVKPVLDIANLSGRLYGLAGRGYELYG
jgi:glycosyltransferase involved in cell wall biosynthesis